MAKFYACIRWLSAIAGAVLLASCASFFPVIGNGEAAIQTRLEGAAFTEVVHVGSFILHFVQSDETKVLVETDSNLVDLIETEVTNGVLTIKPKDFTNIVASDFSQVTVYAPTLAQLTNTGSGDVYCANLVAPSDAVYFGMTGSGSLTLSGEFNRLTVYSTGSGDTTLTGTCSELVYSGLGSGSLDASTLDTGVVQLNSAGSGDMRVLARQQINGTLTGSGSLIYYGSPALQVTTLGSGSISQAR